MPLLCASALRKSLLVLDSETSWGRNLPNDVYVVLIHWPQTFVRNDIQTSNFKSPASGVFCPFFDHGMCQSALFGVEDLP